MIPLVIYHSNCADGFGAAFAAWTMLGDEAEYVPLGYDDKFEIERCADRDVYILDFSFKRDTMEFIFEFANRVIWLDHHKTAFEMWLGRYERGMRYGEPRDLVHPGVTIELDDNKSGAMIAWKYFHPFEEVPILIQHIDDRDRWQFMLKGTREFNAALFSYQPWSFEQWNEWSLHYPKLSSFYWEMIHCGEAILRAQASHVQLIVKNATEIDLHYGIFEHGEYECENFAQGFAVNCPPFLASDVGHELATKSGTFGLCWYMDAQGVVNCSLRSNGDYDVSAIAKSFGGGGHKNSAGFTVPIKRLLSWLK